MSEQATILNYAVLLEKQLEELGGTGAGIHKKLSSIEDRIDDNYKRLIRKIASVRNKAAHVYNYKYGNIEEFTSEADEVISYLESLKNDTNVRYNYSKKCDYPEDKTVYKSTNASENIANRIESFFQNIFKSISKVLATLFVIFLSFLFYNLYGIGGLIVGVVLGIFISSKFINTVSQITLPVILFFVTFAITYSYWGVKFASSEVPSIQALSVDKHKINKSKSTIRQVKVKPRKKTAKHSKKQDNTQLKKKNGIDEETRKLIEQVLKAGL